MVLISMTGRGDGGSSMEPLPRRDKEGWANWLKDHSAIDVLSRDRRGLLCPRHPEGCPTGEIGCRGWHLIHNLC